MISLSLTCKQMQEISYSAAIVFQLFRAFRAGVSQEFNIQALNKDISQEILENGSLQYLSFPLLVERLTCAISDQQKGNGIY